MASRFLDPPDVLGAAVDGRESREVLWVGLLGIQWGDVVGGAVPQNLQLGGGCSGEALGLYYGRGHKQAGRARTGGHTPKFPLLCGLRHFSIVRPRIATGGVQHPGGAVQ